VGVPADAKITYTCNEKNYDDVPAFVDAGTYEVKVLKDKWTTVTVDGKLSAHYENTVLITDGEPEILTVAEGL
jgi:methionyl aminopeptidase